MKEEKRRTDGGEHGKGKGNKMRSWIEKQGQEK